ncbi:hypothetical protein SD427_08155 [Chryseobacterium sp. JJR-5R]|uniref:hypothetical protein n=1 Tax=Chryseobacterium sp. JJR-5R TaxID=3093923 RepID=UPI002A766769|nr:hypothetical protein [Chryseobacterium sp. JJR-5R]WPO84295.1 hypothetical protein SD427_08155 [Chryseobacterium sp. JJR-5R]
MEIKFLLNDNILLSTKYIKVITKKDFDKIIIIKNDIKYANLQFRDILNKDIIIRLDFKGIKSFKNDYFFNVSNLLIKTKEIIISGILNDPLGIYNQGYLDNFKLLTDKKERIKWYELNSKQKYYYLRGCALLSGVRENIDNENPIIIIDLSNAKIDLDVYYEIGKAFFKSYGYFGTEFHSFRDCLINIIKFLKKKEKMPLLRIKGFKNFEEYFLDSDLFNDFYEKFTNVGFEIENIK